MPEMADVRCEECGAVYPMKVGTADRSKDHIWYPGKKCPICGSEKFFPVVKTDKFETKPIAKWKLDKRVGIAAGIVIGVFLIIGIVWTLLEKPHRKAGLKAVYVCDVCKHRFLKSVTGKVPRKCPECKSFAAYRAVQCQNCFTVYPWKTTENSKEIPACPNCKLKSPRIIVRMSDIRTKPIEPEKKDEEAEEDETDEGE
jgi:hypothetical protein